ncbi:hypothetical protein Pyn_22629 [Prunus yedoensis var. nudiflora]|uniref:Uncharacterized protein n=1 Tax=Prunus yedoensis var. nudiflora TaxID=2094558 RepID=A0A314UJR5_PRUYE|nr:hypothetical protein Pyn_22629 [Prunus yedoensis var. nudiflora]
MSSIGATYATVYVMQKRQKEEMEKKLEQMGGDRAVLYKTPKSLHMGGTKRFIRGLFSPRTIVRWRPDIINVANSVGCEFLNL